MNKRNLIKLVGIFFITIAFSAFKLPSLGGGGGGADWKSITGDFNAAIKACESVDDYLGQIIKIANKKNYTSIIIADHGNCEKMVNSDGSQNTSHTINPVPIIIVNSDHNEINNGILADIAPTILDIMGIKKPEEMNGKSLVT